MNRFMLGCIMIIFSGINFAGQAENNKDKNAQVFVSFSMPKQDLKQWISEANQYQIPVVIRGLVNNSFKDTVKALTNLDENHKLDNGVQLNPNLFQEFNIKKVPAVVVANEDHSKFDVMYGDVHLKYALEKIAKDGDTRTTAKKLLGQGD